ncbi:MAG: hypothetical protein WDA16_12000 [Candidatus Thermoplasmatota archaeon]
MAEVAGFRPSDEERRVIARTRATMGLKSDSEAIRFLIRKGAEHVGPLKNDPVFRFRLKGKKRHSSVTPEEIDALVYHRP